MLHSNQNIRLELLANGKPCGIGGMPGCGVLTCEVTWVRRDPRAAPREMVEDPEYSEADWVCNEVHFRLGGLDSSAEKHVVWSGEPLNVGDEVSIRVLPPGEFDPPPHKHSAALPPFRTVRVRHRSRYGGD